MKRASICLSLAWLVLALPAFAAVTGHFDRTLKVSGAVQLEVETGSGDISVRKGDDGSVRVYGTIRAGEWFSGGDPAEKVRRLEKEPPIDQAGNIIHIGRISEWSLRQNVSISYEVVVPANTRVELKTGSGRVELESVAGPARLQTGSGDVRAGNIGGMVDANTGSGSIELASIKGDVKAHTGSGDVRVEGAPNVDVETGSGAIKVLGLRGSFRAHTGSGDVDAEGTPERDWRVDTSSGTVTLRLAGNTGFDFSAHTGSGEIESQQPLTISGSVSKHDLQGRVRGGGPRIEVRTGSGDVRLM